MTNQEKANEIREALKTVQTLALELKADRYNVSAIVKLGGSGPYRVELYNFTDLKMVKSVTTREEL